MISAIIIRQKKKKSQSRIVQSEMAARCMVVQAHCSVFCWLHPLPCANQVSDSCSLHGVSKYRMLNQSRIKEKKAI